MVETFTILDSLNAQRMYPSQLKKEKDRFSLIELRTSVGSAEGTRHPSYLEPSV